MLDTRFQKEISLYIYSREYFQNFTITDTTLASTITTLSRMSKCTTVGNAQMTIWGQTKLTGIGRVRVIMFITVFCRYCGGHKLYARSMQCTFDV